ncbi:MAG: hypothetical protein QXW07_02700, partial [Candidatus Woesearchaeota archaeon]
RKRISELALATYKALNVRDWCRIDMRMDAHNRPQVLEINPLPGIIPDPEEHSNLPTMWYSMGLTYEQLINTVLYHAAARYGLKMKFKKSLVVKDLQKRVEQAYKRSRK